MWYVYVLNSNYIKYTIETQLWKLIIHEEKQFKNNYYYSLIIIYSSNIKL